MTGGFGGAWLLAAGAAFAGGAGTCLWGAFSAARLRARVRGSVRLLGGRQRAAEDDGDGMGRRLLSFARSTSSSLALGAPSLARGALGRSAWFSRSCAPAGLEGEVSERGFCETRVRLCVAGGVCGAVLGLAVSAELACALAVVGAVFGFRALGAAVRRRIAWRARELERHLPEMLDVVALGMRSGLSFDRSLALYTGHFDTLLARALGSAQRQWLCGLAPRDECLRHVAATYDSPIFARVAEGIVRSLRFGTSMAEGLEAAAREARAAYRARRQEQVAKTPVKMMVPTGALILPAMLIMVLGPVLLELAGGF